jgi:hypothetical protein
MLRVKKHKITNFRSEFYKNIITIAGDRETEMYNFNSVNDLFNGNVTVVNLYSIDNTNYLKNIAISRYLQNNYDNLNVFDIILKKKYVSKLDDVLELINGQMGKFIRKNAIKHPIFYAREDVVGNEIKINSLNNKILVLDELFNLKYVFDDTVEINGLEANIEKVSKNGKYIRKKQVNSRKIAFGENSDFINSPNKIILVEDYYDFPVFITLDSSLGRILVTKINGEIIYDIMSENFCLPSGIKYKDKKLYVTDMCDSSIKTINLDKQEIETIVKDDRLFGISDFEFLPKGDIVVSKKWGSGIGFYNIQEKKYMTLEEEFHTGQKIGKVNKIVNYGGKYYFFDATNSVLYSFGDAEGLVAEVNLKAYDNIAPQGEIENFYIDNIDNIYFMDQKNDRILHRIKGDIFIKNFSDFLESPSDMLIFKNMMFVSSKGKLQKINFYRNKYISINPYFSESSRNFFDEGENIDIKNLQRLTIPELKEFLDKIDIIPHSPSFLMVLENNNSRLMPVKTLYHNDIKNEEDFHLEGKKDYILYGKIYVRDGSNIMIKKIKFILEAQ